MLGKTLRALAVFGIRGHLGLLASLLALAVAAHRSAADEAGSPFHVLVFSKTLGYRHASIKDGIQAIRELGQGHGFEVEATEDSGAFTPANLARFQVVVFLSVTGNVLDPAQEAAFKDYLLEGGGFAAIHGAVYGPSACEDGWGWYGGMFCCAFDNHSAVVPGVVDVEDPSNPSTANLPARWTRVDEWYNFSGSPRGCARVLATVDESTYQGGRMGGDHPIAWCRRVGKGRMWYTAMGHAPESFAEPLFRQHLLGGIVLAAARMPSDFAPNARAAAVLAWSRDAGAVSLLQGGQVVWRFNYGANRSKPFFHPLAVPDGPVLTWDQPPDHPWHHGLWFSWKFIDGINYWEENAGTGRADGLTIWREPQIETRPDFSARITIDLDYQPAGGPPVMREHRVIEVSRPDLQGTYHLDWVLTFTAADKDVLLDRTPLAEEPGGKPWGGYAGLSVRLAHGMQDIWAVTSQGPAGLASGTFRGRAAAMDYSGVIDKREVGVSILDHPGNLNAPSPWYAISDGTMSYFSPAVLCYQRHVLKAHESLELRYRVVVHAARWDGEQLRLASERYAEKH